MESQEIIVFDVETTGTDSRRDQVIELCVQFGLSDDAQHRVWRIRPDAPIHPEAQAVHGISAEDLRDCPRFEEVADSIRDVLAPAEVLVGYNLAFDIGMLQAEYARLNQILDLRSKRVVDPFRLWQQCEPRSLMHAHQRFVGDSFSEAHSAAADVAATGRVLRGMLTSFNLADRDWEDVAAVCEPESATWVGSSRHLRWSEDGRPTLGFGKHKGKALDQLARSEDDGYLHWILGNDFPAHVHQICVQALELPAEQFLDWVRETHGPPPALDEDGRAEGMPDDRNDGSYAQPAPARSAVVPSSRPASPPSTDQTNPGANSASAQAGLEDPAATSNRTSGKVAKRPATSRRTSNQKPVKSGTLLLPLGDFLLPARNGS